MHSVHVPAFDLNLLVAFDAIWAERNVTRAARRIGRTQSATSHALARLREHLGDPLFSSTPSGMVPTPRAQALEGPLREALALLRRTLEGPPAFDPLREARTFTLSATDFATLAVVPPLLRDLATRAPRFDLVVRPAADDVAQALQGGEIDLLVGVNLRARPGVAIAHLFRDDFVCVRRRPRGRRLPRLTLDRYTSIPHLLVSPGGTGDAPVDIALRQVGRKRRVVLRLPHFLVAPLVLAESDYVITVPSRLAAVFAGLLPLAVEPPPIPIDGFDVQMAWHERQGDDPAHAHLRARILATTQRGEAKGPRKRRAAT